MAITNGIWGGGDDKTLSTVNGINLFVSGPMFIQYSGPTVANSVVESTLFGSTLANNTQTSNFGPGFPEDSSSLALPGSLNVAGTLGALTLGTMFSGRLVCSYNSTSTPTLRLRTVLRNAAGTIAYTIADTGVLTTSALTSGPFAMDIKFDLSVASVGTAGSMRGRIQAVYGTTTTASAFLNTPLALTATTVDTSQTYTVDLLATWGTASASNTITALYGTFGVAG